MSQHPTTRGVASGQREPAFMAAVLNGSLILFVPIMVSALAMYTSSAVRPSPPTLLSSIIEALPMVLALAPVALVVGWRTYIHARAYRRNRLTLWRGPAESAAIAGAIALMVMARATTATWAREPLHLVIAYISFYVGATALVGLAMGLVLTAMALLALHLQARVSARRNDAV